jgi:hypothetical protein
MILQAFCCSSDHIRFLSPILSGEEQNLAMLTGAKLNFNSMKYLEKNENR